MNDTDILLSTERALWGNISANLRGVFITRHNIANVYINFYYDKPYSEDEEEMASLTFTEIISDFPDSNDLDYKLHTRPVPQKLPFEGICVYLRYDELGSVENYQPYTTKSFPVDVSSQYIASKLSIIKAMWGKITPNIRRLAIAEDFLSLLFCYEFPPSQEEIQLAEMIRKEYASFFQANEEIRNIVNILESKEWTPKDGIAAYVRYPELGKV